MPVHYRRGKAPPTVQPGFEWDGNKYDVHQAWARAYDVTLVRTGDGADPAARVFREEAFRTRLLSHRGNFFLYDTSALATPILPPSVPSRGTPRPPPDLDD